MNSRENRFGQKIEQIPESELSKISGGGDSSLHDMPKYTDTLPTDPSKPGEKIRPPKS